MDALLRQLPDDAGAAARDALTREDWGSARGSITQALSAVEWPRRPAPIPLAHELSPPQRALAQLLASRPGTHVPAAFAIPQSAWNRRRWLGLDPPSVLEREATFDGASGPLWRLCVSRAGDDVALTALLRAIPLPERLRAFRDLRMSAYGCAMGAPWVVARALVEDGFGDEAHEWAPRLADEMLAMWVDDVTERGGLRVLVDELRWTSFLPLARAGVPLERRWEVLLPLNVGPWEPWMHECVQALPEKRRKPAVEAALRNQSEGAVLAIGLSLLAREPSEWLARKVLSCARKDDRTSEAEVLAEVGRIAEGAPAVRAALDAYVARRKPAPPLRVVQVVRPRSLDDVPEPRRAQLAAVSGRDDLLEPDALLAIVDLAEPRSTRTYVAFLHHADSGVVLAGGTTRVLARLLQGGVECADPALREALKVAIAGALRAP